LADPDPNRESEAGQFRTGFSGQREIVPLDCICQPGKLSGCLDHSIRNVRAAGIRSFCHH
jgi:hypothetical protein